MKKLFFVALLSSLAIGSARADNPDLNAIIGVSDDVMGNYAFVPNNGDDVMLGYGLSLSDLNSFAVEYDNDSGMLKGHGRCSSQVGDNQNQTWTNPTMFDSLTDETGQTGAQYCYCGLDSYTPLNGSAQSLSGPWVFNYQDNNANGCGISCAEECSYGLSFVGDRYLAFRSAIFNAYAPGTSGGASGTSSVVTTQTYVDNALAGKQAKITTTGTNKLMTYGASTGATPGSRDIVSTLGTSTTATTVPETGPIVAGINSKQDAVNGTADYVMTGTGTAGTVGEKPVYSLSPTSNSLVEAQTINTVVTAAANSEMIPIEGWFGENGEYYDSSLLWQINTSVSNLGLGWSGVFSDAVGGCYKSYVHNFDPDYSNQGACDNTVYNSLNVGQWASKFNVNGENQYIVGDSACSGDNGDVPGQLAMSQSTINNAYANNPLLNNGNDVPQDRWHCYCRVRTRNGTSAVSQWVYGGTPGMVPAECFDWCTALCEASFGNNENTKSIMLDGAQ